MRKKISTKTIERFSEENSLTVFYEEAAKEMGLSVDESSIFDCRRILVASNIIQAWYADFEEKYGKGCLAELAQHLLLLGPKENHDLEENEVEILEGFITSNNISTDSL